MSKLNYLRPLIFLIIPIISPGQTSFTKVTNTQNEISSHPAVGSYTGAFWIDYDSDGDLDLFVSPNSLYRNDGSGTFVRLQGHGIGQASGLGNGNTWGDLDNDGDPDLARTNSNSTVHLNTDTGFVKLKDPPFNNLGFRGWSGAWGDYDNDGFLDLLLVHPAGFLGQPQKNRMFRNDGDGRLTEVFNDVTDQFSAYTGCTWTDFDLDGDLDVFIGSGEVSFLSEDDIFLNLLAETGSPDLVRMDTGLIATELRDGQNWNWVDYDNDGDLDGYVTNYIGTRKNDFFRNDGNYNFTKLSNIEIGDIVDQNGAGLGNLWGDFDNDGDLDCFVTFDGGMDRYYRNDSTYFNEVTNALSKTGSSRGASAGDYDEDGFLDVFVSSASTNSVGLYHNDGNPYHWVQFDLEGVVSNRSGIGAIVRILADIDGTPTWQTREVNSQSSFCGSNALRVHFGLKTALFVDSVVVQWPSGQLDVYSNLMMDQIHPIRETIPSGFLRANFRADQIYGIDSLSVNFLNWSIADPADSIVSYSWDFDEDGLQDSSDPEPSWTFDRTDSLYTVRLVVESQTGSRDTLTRVDYIAIDTMNISGIGLDLVEKFRLYPNPSESEFNLNYHGLGHLDFKVFDMKGKLVYEGNSVDIKSFGREWKPGIYFLQMRDSNEFLTLKLVKR